MAEKKVTLEIKNVSKSFAKVENDEVTHALNEIDLTLESGEFVSLVGPSGCGKSTILRLVAGLITPTTGKLTVDGKEITEPSPERGMMFQKSTLFPWLTVEKNIAFSLKMQGKLKGNEDKVERLLKVIGLEAFRNDYPGQLSGGMAQRVALMRSLINEPDILLLDEPLGALDMRLRKDMQNELKRIQQEMEITFIYVTHDQEEALAMSDTVVVMDGGRIQQIGTPEDIYNEPQNAFVADFIGESNIIDGIMRSDGVVEIFNRKFQCLDKGFAKDEPVDVVIRPEDVDIVDEAAGQLKGTVTSVTFKGVHYDTIVDFKGFKWLIQTTDYHPEGETIGIILNPDDIHIMRKSEYSGMFGDYSSYSEEYDELEDVSLLEEDGEGGDEE